jgi:sirohydrochlorin cobaltochelatase
MPAAPFVWREDGRPDWAAMWTSFSDLALYGGPPHRGPEQALRGPETATAEAVSDPAILAEMKRGIRETTGLVAESPSPGWIAIACESPAMAGWLAAAIVLENVEARTEGDRVLLPAGPRFRLENEVKSLVTVVAKTHHYWTMHAARNGVPGPLKLGVGGPGDGKTALVDALRRRYGRRRAVVVPPGGPIEVTDSAVDLVLVELGEDSSAASVGGAVVEATVGVFSAAAAAAALSRSERSLEAWHLLVVSTTGAAKADRSPLEDEVRRRRGEHPMVFVDLATAEGIDVIVAWLRQELAFEPWRERRDRVRP